MNDPEFLNYMLAAADDGVSVSCEQVTRLKRLADYADGAHPPPGWWGALDYGAVLKAAERAWARMGERDVKDKEVSGVGGQGGGGQHGHDAALAPAPHSIDAPHGWDGLTNVR